MSAYPARGDTPWDVTLKAYIDGIATAPWTFVDAYKNASQGSMSVNTWTKVTFQAEITDNLGEYASSTFTAAVDGIYSLNTAVLFGAAAAGSLLDLAIVVNGTQLQMLASLYAPTGDQHNLYGNLPVALTAGQTLEVNARSSAASVGISSGDSNTYLRICRQR